MSVRVTWQLLAEGHVREPEVAEFYVTLRVKQKVL